MNLEKKALGVGSIKGLNFGDGCLKTGIILTVIGYIVSRKSSVWVNWKGYIEYYENLHDQNRN